MALPSMSNFEQAQGLGFIKSPLIFTHGVPGDAEQRLIDPTQYGTVSSQRPLRPQPHIRPPLLSGNVLGYKPNLFLQLPMAVSLHLSVSVNLARQYFDTHVCAVLPSY
jgi:hypothetical protein